MNDPGKEAGSWLELALPARPHFSPAMMRGAQMDLVCGGCVLIQIDTFQKSKAEVKKETQKYRLKKMETGANPPLDDDKCQDGVEIGLPITLKKLLK